jgi:tetratricopeptide (TPR) repeat protein
MNGGWTYFSAGMSAEASQQAAKMIEIDPDFYGGHWLQGAIHLSEGEFESAVERLRTAVSLGGHPVVIADFGSACALAGRDDEADAILRQLLEMRRQRYVPASCLARVYGRLGDIEKATEWVETAFAERNGADGMRTGNVETLKRSFHEQAILCGYLDDHLIAGPIAELYAWVDSNPAPAATGVPYECEVLGIDVTGRVATATVRETDHHGAVIDYFQLLRVGDSWSIVSKLWDAESPPP